MVHRKHVHIHYPQCTQLEITGPHYGRALLGANQIEPSHQVQGVASHVAQW